MKAFQLVLLWIMAIAGTTLSAIGFLVCSPLLVLHGLHGVIRGGFRAAINVSKDILNARG